MKKTIWKFPLGIESSQRLNLPVGFQILSLQVQEEVPCIWALVDPTASTRPVNLEIYGTGHTIYTEIDNETMEFIGTFQKGSYVFHAFIKHLTP